VSGQNWFHLEESDGTADYGEFIRGRDPGDAAADHRDRLAHAGMARSTIELRPAGLGMVP
jgi:hypothetical protein